MVLGGFSAKLREAKILATGEKVNFTQEKLRIKLSGLPKEIPDPIAGVTVLALEFDGPANWLHFPAVPALNRGKAFK